MDSLHKVAKNARLNYDELIIVLIEMEAMINSRPLTYLSKKGNTEAITPFHLLHDRNIIIFIIIYIIIIIIIIIIITTIIIISLFKVDRIVRYR